MENNRVQSHNSWPEPEKFNYHATDPTKRRILFSLCLPEQEHQEVFRALLTALLPFPIYLTAWINAGSHISKGKKGQRRTLLV